MQKFGKRNGKQRFQCTNCKYVFQNKSRKKIRFIKKLWKEYVKQKQTYKQLAQQYDISTRTVQRTLDKHEVNKRALIPTGTVVLMDTCYFGREYGVMVFRDEYSKKNLHWKFVRHESLEEYISGIEWLKNEGWKIQGIVCDGKRGLFSAFGNMPVQMCQFHQMMIVTRYITKNPKTVASQELKELVDLLTQTDKESFAGGLNDWQIKWKDFISEKTYNEQNKRKWHYTHKRLRSAYNSLKNNLPYLFTWYDNMHLKIPNTINSLEGIFSNLKSKLRVHAGLIKDRKIKLINQILND